MIAPQAIIRVRDGVLSAKVQWPDANWQETEIDGKLVRWFSQRIDLFERAAERRIASLKGCDGIAGGLWVLAEKADAGEIIPISGESIADHLPWEAFEAKFLNKAVVFHPVRVVPVQPVAPANIDAAARPIRVAFLVGHEGEGTEFDRHAAVQELIDVIKASEFTADTLNLAQNLLQLDLVTASREDRRRFFQSNAPHVVFYFGHGKGGSNPSIGIGPGWKDKDWLPIKDIADDAAAAGVFPHSWIFLACSVGEPGSPNAEPSLHSGPASPEAFRALAAHGAKAMLAMRARVRPDIARLVGASLLESISAGYPLELGAGLARKIARRSRINNNYCYLDWATPAVWSATPSVSPPKLSTVAPTILAAKLMRTEADDPGLGLSRLVGPNETAEAWQGLRRIRANAPGMKAPEILARCATIGGAFTARFGRPAVFIPTNDMLNFGQRLANWSKERLRGLDPDERASPLGGALVNLAKQDPAGLEQLLATPSMVLLLEDPPAADDAAAWSLLESAPNTSTVVIAVKSTNLVERADWHTEDLAMAQQVVAWDQLCQAFPRSMALFVALEMPVTAAAVRRLAEEALTDEAVAPFTVPMTSGVVMTGSAKREVRARLEAGAVAAAHTEVFKALERRPPQLESDNRFAPLRHLVGSNGEGLADYVTALIDRYEHRWVAADWLRLAQVLGPASERWSELPPRIILRIAGVLAELQLLSRAADWLDAIAVDEPLTNARRAHIQSEIAKAEGTPEGEERMWAEAARAEELLRGVLEVDPGNVEAIALLRNVLANRARLELYFHHNAEAAANLYRQLNPELASEDSQEAQLLRVVCLRNLAECLFEFSPFREQVESRLEARALLVAGEALAIQNGQNHVLCELLYSAAKLDEVLEDWHAAQDHLTRAANAATTAENWVCKAIAEMRLLMLRADHFDQPFDIGLFELRLQRLAFADSHAWARRFAALSRLWAARRLALSGNRDRARTLVQTNIASIRAPATLQAGGDRRVLAESYAGLDFLTPQEVADRPWSIFKAIPWAEDWLAQHGGNDREHYWDGGV
jgi:hypothetical protein